MDNSEGIELENIEAVPQDEKTAQQQTEEVMNTAMGVINNAADAAFVPNPAANDKPILGDGETAASCFAGLPLEALIAKPLTAAALAQQEMNAIYVDTVLKLAYKDGTGAADTTANTVEIKLQRPVIKSDGDMGYNAQSPLAFPCSDSRALHRYHSSGLQHRGQNQRDVQL